jgi:RepB DNA-primase from phage plasmid
MNTDPVSDGKEVTAPDYILENFELSDRIAILVRDSKRGETIQRITTADNAASPDFQAWLRHKNLSSDVYIGMNTLKRDAQSRTKEDIEKIRHLYLDIDRRGPEALDAIRKSSAVPPPNYVLQTSPEKFQVVWKVENISQDQAEGLQRAMVREFGGDPAATDSTRVLRLPTFVNRKYGQEHTVAARSEATTTYRLEDFRLRTDAQDEKRERPASGRSAVDGEITQSERDWAFAKRALARGDDIEEVIRRIADYRGDEKHSNYARYTVEKAKAALHSKSNVGPPPEQASFSRESVDTPAERDALR